MTVCYTFCMVKRERTRSMFPLLSVGATLAAVILFVVELVAYSRSRAQMPPGLQIGGVSVGGLGREQALAQVANVYSTPVELLYRDTAIQLAPEAVSFRLETDAMLAAADQFRTDDPFWEGFWDHLWRQSGQVQSLPLRATYSEAQLREFLNDVAARYDRPASAVQPLTGTLEFSAGAPGHSLDVETSLDVVAAVLQRPSDRRAMLVSTEGSTARSGFEALETLLKQYIQDQGFEGLVDMAVIDLQSGGELHLARMKGQDLPRNPDIAFAGMDIMKVAIMLESFRQWDGEPPPETSQLLGETIELSGNDKANLLLAQLGAGRSAEADVQPLSGPVGSQPGPEEQGAAAVTETLRRLGLESSFMAGAYDQAEVPNPITTPANQREDIHTAPDVRMQTTPTDAAFLLMSVYQCAQGGGGALAAVFPHEVTRAECEQMVEHLARNRIGVLIEAGVPEGTRVAHKQGWTGDTNGDAAIVFTPGGDYVLTLFLWQQEYLPWEESSPLMADLSRAVYNYFNAPGR